MALGLGIFFCSSAELAAEQRCTKNRQAHLNGENTKGDQGEHPAVEHHHCDVNDGKCRIENGGKGLTSEEIADLLQLGHPRPQFTHGPTVEITQRQAEQVIDHFSAETLVDPVGGFGEQEGLETAKHPFQNGDHHQGYPKDLQRVEAALADHLVDDHLDQQRVGQGEQLDHKTGRQHLNQHTAVALQRWPKPAGAELLIGRGVGPLHQKQFNAFRELICQLFRFEGDDAVLGRRQLQPAFVAGNHQGKSSLPREHGGNLQTGTGYRRHPCRHHVKAETGRKLTTKLKVQRQPPAQVVLEHLLDRIAPERQLHQLRQHLETGQGLLQCTVGPDQPQAVDNVALWAVTADGGKDLSILDGFERR